MLERLYMLKKDNLDNESFVTVRKLENTIKNIKKPPEVFRKN